MCSTQLGKILLSIPSIIKHTLKICSDPWVTAVGGTVIGNTKNGPSGTFSDGTFEEYVWSDVGNTASAFGSAGPFGATGGGVSALFDRPSYQSALTIQDSTGKPVSGRAIPDIAGMVGCHGYVINTQVDQTLIGTSITTPMYAGLFAVLRSALGQSFGPLNSLLYTIGPTFPLAFKDITFGDNDSGPGVPFFSAGPGWDAASGWGSVNGANVEDGLARLLYPKNFYITVRKNSFGIDEGQSFFTFRVAEHILSDMKRI
jgi:kumamolisin